MNDSNTPIGAEQPCTGQHGGHLPFDEHDRITGHPYWAGVSGYPDLRLYFVPAAEGLPCLGRYIRQRGTGYDVMDIPHINSASIHFIDRPPGTAPALIAAQRDAAGRIRIQDWMLDTLPIAEQRHIRAGWRTAFSDLAKLPGRHPVDVAAHIEQLRVNYELQKPTCARLGHPTHHPSHKECIPQDDTIEASRERLRQKGFSWTKLKRIWRQATGNSVVWYFLPLP